MKTTSVISLITAALMLAGCAQESKTSSNKQTQQSPTKATAEQQIKNKKSKDTELAKQASNELILHDVALHKVEHIAEQKQKMAKPAARAKLAYIQNTSAAQQMMMPQPFPATEITNREKYAQHEKNGTLLVSEQPVSTFSIDVDTAAYSNVRRMLNQGKMPQRDAIRLEELINYFSYDYPTPKNEPFSVYTEVGPSPYNVDKQLIHIGIQGKSIPKSNRPASNLVFLLDVSGSMNHPNKIGLLKNALKMLTNQLNEQDSVAIVVYAGAAGTVLKPTKGNNKQAIIDALAYLSAGGSTNGGAGIESAYRLAQQSFISNGINRVILATDGDFNVGTVNNQALKNLIENKRKSGVELSILGFGMNNYNDELMQQLAQNGNGNAYYIDNLNEARKVLVEEMSSTLFTIAKDVKIQMEFNPQLVSEYRLLGYETRALQREDFNNDKVDAGEIGAGHTVTAIYEVSLIGSTNKAIDPLRYQTEKTQLSENTDELAFLRLRYKSPKGNTSKLLEFPIDKSSMTTNLTQTSDNYRFSAAVAGFGELLQGGENLSTMTQNDIIALAQQSKGKDKNGYRGEFISLMKLAQALSPVTIAKQTIDE